MSLTADQKRAVERATIEVGNAVEYFQIGNVEGLRVVSMNPEGVQYTVRYFRLCADK